MTFWHGVAVGVAGAMIFWTGLAFAAAWWFFPEEKEEEHDL